MSSFTNNPFLCKTKSLFYTWPKSVLYHYTRVKYLLLSICIILSLLEVLFIVLNVLSKKHIVIVYLYAAYCLISLIVATIGVFKGSVNWSFRMASIFLSFVFVYFRIVQNPNNFRYFGHLFLSIMGVILSFMYAYLIERKKA